MGQVYALWTFHRLFHLQEVIPVSRPPLAPLNSSSPPDEKSLWVDGGAAHHTANACRLVMGGKDLRTIAELVGAHF